MRNIHTLTQEEIIDLLTFLGQERWLGKDFTIEYKNASDTMSQDILDISGTTREEYQYIKVTRNKIKGDYISIGQNGYIARVKTDVADTDLMFWEYKLKAVYWFLQHGFEVSVNINGKKKTLEFKE